MAQALNSTGYILQVISYKLYSTSLMLMLMSINAGINRELLADHKGAGYLVHAVPQIMCSANHNPDCCAAIGRTQ